MEYVMAVVVIIMILGTKVFYDTKRMKEETIALLKQRWGKVPECDYTDDKYQEIKKYYQTSVRKDTDIDETTWNDMDMDTVYERINNTSSSIGEEYLYALLHRLEYDIGELKNRDRLIRIFQEQEEDRIKLQCALSYLGKLRGLSFYKNFGSMTEVKTNPVKHLLMGIGFLASIIAMMISYITSWHLEIFVVLFLAVLANNVIQYYRRKAQIEKYYYVLSYVLKLLFSVEKLSELDIPALEDYQNHFKQVTEEFRTFRKRAKFVTGGNNMSGSLLDVIMDYIRMLFHVDLYMFDKMINQLIHASKTVQSLYEDIGYLDSMVAVASFRTMLQDDYCTPVFLDRRKPMLYAKGMYHPLITDPVKNTISEDRCVLITGSNASGKSTFIKTTAMNAILAQTIYTCLCESYEATFFQIYSSMALTDNLMGKESYYIVEIKSLKRILDRTQNGPFVLCFVDEVLRGTNTLERIAASSQILKTLAKRNVLCFAATHDIELTYILERYYQNYHFQEEIAENKVIFNYQLKSGRAQSRNAIKLLKMIGYPDEITEEASKEANYFLSEGVWQVQK